VSAVICYYPRREDYADNSGPPEEFEEWAPLSGFCNHLHCQQADYYRRLYAASPKPLTREEKEMIESDTELMHDEFHGRDLDGRIR